MLALLCMGLNNNGEAVKVEREGDLLSQCVVYSLGAVEIKNKTNSNTFWPFGFSWLMGVEFFFFLFSFYRRVYRFDIVCIPYRFHPPKLGNKI